MKDICLEAKLVLTWAKLNNLQLFVGKSVQILVNLDSFIFSFDFLKTDFRKKIQWQHMLLSTPKVLSHLRDKQKIKTANNNSSIQNK